MPILVWSKCIVKQILFRNSKAFTLIELLIVVSIIGILMAIGLINYRIFIDKAEDAQRVSDLRFIQSALEQYRADQHYYPPSSDLVKSGSSLNSPDEGKTYLGKIPKDPRFSGDSGYLYTPKGAGCTADNPGSCIDYCLYAKLSTPQTGDQSCSSFADTKHNFGLAKP